MAAQPMDHMWVWEKRNPVSQLLFGKGKKPTRQITKGTGE
jgi:hypothetical protein